MTMRVALIRSGRDARMRGDVALVASAVVASICMGWLITRMPHGDTGQRVVLAILLMLNVIAAAVASGRANMVGIAAGLYLLGVQIIGWSIPHSGRLLAAVSVMTAAVLVAASARPLGADRRTFLRFPLLIGPLVAVPSVLSAAAAANLPLALQRCYLLLVPLSMIFALRRVDPLRTAWGIAVGVNLTLSLLLVSGIVAPLDLARFGGGKALLVHPNLAGLAGWTSAVAWMALPGRSRVARIPGITVSTAIVLMSDSRSSIGALLVAVTLLGWGAHRRSRARRGPAENVVLTLLFMTLAVGATAYVAREFVLVQRSAGSGVLSGRQDQWNQALTQYRGGTVIERALGTSSGGVGGSLANDQAGAQNVSKYTTTARFETVDSAIPALLLRSGFIGLCAGVAGLVGILRLLRQYGTRAEAAAPAAILAGALVTIPVESWFFSGGSMWIWMLAAARLLDLVQEEK
jgi:hypothetical protein